MYERNPRRPKNLVCLVSRSFLRQWFEVQYSMANTSKLLFLVLYQFRTYHILALADNVYYWTSRSQSPFCEMQIVLDILPPDMKNRGLADRVFLPFQ